MIRPPDRAWLPPKKAEHPFIVVMKTISEMLLGIVMITFITAAGIAIALLLTSCLQEPIEATEDGGTEGGGEAVGADVGCRDEDTEGEGAPCHFASASSSASAGSGSGASEGASTSEGTSEGSSSSEASSSAGSSSSSTGSDGPAAGELYGPCGDPACPFESIDFPHGCLCTHACTSDDECEDGGICPETLSWCVLPYPDACVEQQTFEDYSGTVEPFCVWPF